MNGTKKRIRTIPILRTNKLNQNDNSFRTVTVFEKERETSLPPLREEDSNSSRSLQLRKINSIRTINNGSSSNKSLVPLEDKDFKSLDPDVSRSSYSNHFSFENRSLRPQRSFLSENPLRDASLESSSSRASMRSIQLDDVKIRPPNSENPKDKHSFRQRRYEETDQVSVGDLKARMKESDSFKKLVNPTLYTGDDTFKGEKSREREGKQGKSKVAANKMLKKKLMDVRSTFLNFCHSMSKGIPAESKLNTIVKLDGFVSAENHKLQQKDRLSHDMLARKNKTISELREELNGYKTKSKLLEKHVKELTRELNACKAKLA